MSPFDAGERFEVGNQLGAGSFGVVYEAFDREHNRIVALKVLERAVPDTVARFKREFRSLAELRHRNLASLYELLVIRERWILSMERIAGCGLLDHLAAANSSPPLFDQLLPMRRAIGLRRANNDRVRESFGQLATGIAALHAHGVVHRDIKPSNVMITASGRVVLLDFGLAIEVAADDSIDRMTIVGTPGYMSPEQVRGAPPSAAGDWYGFGVLLFQALTGSMPFSGQTALEILECQMRQPPPATGASPELDALCRDLLTADATQRPGDCEVLERLGVDPVPARIQRSAKRPRRLIGRAGELLALEREFRAVTTGHPRVVFLHGAPGCGKSALAGAFLDRLRATSDAWIVGGRCRPWESVPLNAVDSLVDSLARSLRHDPSTAVGDVLGRSVAATHLFPALAPLSLLRSGDETVQVPANGARLLARAATELRAIFAAAAQDRPIVILIDDAQWAAVDGARMIADIVGGMAADRLLLVVCGREEPASEAFVDALRAGGAVVREIELRDLPRGNPALKEIMAAEESKSLGGAIERRLRRLSLGACALFGKLIESDGPLQEREAAASLQIADLDEPLRTLTREQLVRVWRQSGSRAIDVYHPRMRRAMRRRRSRIILTGSELSR